MVICYGQSQENNYLVVLECARKWINILRRNKDNLAQ